MSLSAEPAAWQVWRREVPHVLGVLVGRHGDWGDCEDAVQEALVAAHQQWAGAGVPEHPRGWLIRVAERRLIDARRSRRARAVREGHHATDRSRHPPVGVDARRDDTLEGLLLCCHPALTPPTRVALTLRVVGGLTTAQVAAAFFVPESTMAQRLSRAKQTLAGQGVGFGALSDAELPDRLSAALRVLCLIFTEGHTAAAGEDLADGSLAAEAIRLTRALRVRLPADPEVAGLLALMLLTQARRAARTDATGELIALADQDRRLWDADAIAEGIALVEGALPRGGLGPFQVQAAIAAVHSEAGTVEETDWAQIVALYQLLDEHVGGPWITLNLGVAIAELDGALAGLARVDPLLDDPTMARQHRLHAVRGHLLARVGRRVEARTAYALAARLATNAREQRYLNARLAEL